MKKLYLALLAAIGHSVSAPAEVQFSSVTTYSQEQPALFSFQMGTVTKIQGSLPMTVDLANVNEATSFRVNSSTMWHGTDFTVLLGQDPKYKRGAKTATISVPMGTIKLSWTATNVTFTGTLADNAFLPFFGVTPTVIPLGIAGRFTTNTTIALHFQYFDYSHVATIIGTNKLVTYSVPFNMPGFPPSTSSVTVNTGVFEVVADLQPPVIKFNSPAQNTVITTSDVNINVTVSDNVALGSGPIWLGAGSVLSYSINGGSSYGDPNTFPDVGSTTHNLNFNGLLNPGTNAITFIAADSSGNLGTNKIVLFYSEKSPITLATNGVGSITGVTNGQQLDTGRNYTVVAKPGVGKVFAGWTDDNNDLVSQTATYTFSMRPGLTLTASFVATPFTEVAGSYQGFFQATAFTNTPGSIGGVKLTVTSSGSFSGGLTSGAGSGSFSGTFFYSASGVQSGNATVVTPKSTNFLYLSIVTDSNQPNFGVVQGYVRFADTAGLKSVRPNQVGYIADLNAGRVTNASVLSAGAGTYHFVVNPQANDVNLPGGSGFGTITVAANGTATGSLVLADGDAPATTFSSQLVYTGYLPVFVPLYNKAGGFLMALDLSTVPTDGTATSNTQATWVKSAGKVFYPDGFSTSNDVFVARYTNAPSGILFGSATFQLDPDVFINASVNSTNGTFGLTVPDATKVKGTVTAAGAITGSFVDNGVTRTYKAFVVPTHTSPKGFEAGGFFVRSNQTGMVSIQFSEVP
ncbi:MAG: hypothetical protein JWO95_1929 [Verrucomicrobiales bacterium]|nr:hypothetical protein [Verrucomicrobiales bacterium]